MGNRNRTMSTSYSVLRGKETIGISYETSTDVSLKWALSLISSVSLPPILICAIDRLTYLIEIMRREDNMAVHGSSNNFDNLDKAFVIFKLPGPGHFHRRVDFISAPKERYAAAVLSWSGSMMFERDLK